MPKGVVVNQAFVWGNDRQLRTPLDRTLIYEVHVKGFTKLHPEVPEELRGTYAGLGSAAAVDYLTNLGITAVELLPVHQHVNERHLVERGLSNYWGYNTIGFFAPDVRYSATGEPVSEFKTMVKRLHDAGIEVILDVVYNHTGEGDHLGPTLSFRGIDNAAYYRLDPDDPRTYVDYTGTGNTLDATSPRVLQLIMDSLRYWITDMHVDGFRFDLASALAREMYDVDKLGQLLRHHSPGPDHQPGQAHRRAVGRRPGRLPGRQLSGRLGGVERQVPRHGAPLLEGRRRAGGRAGVSAQWLIRPVCRLRASPARQHQLRHRPRRVHAQRPRELRVEAQRGQRRGQQRRG